MKRQIVATFLVLSFLFLVGWTPPAFSASVGPSSSEGRLVARPVVGTAFGYLETENSDGLTVYEPAVLGVMTLGALGYSPSPWWSVYGAYGPATVVRHGHTDTPQVAAIGAQYDDAWLQVTLFVGSQLGLSWPDYQSPISYFVGVGFTIQGWEIDIGDLGSGPLLTASDIESDLLDR